jgi:hypothetical protein
MFNGLFGIGRAYKKLPEHHNFTELANNIERLANALMNQSLGFWGKDYLNASTKWQHQLGDDLMMLVDYARTYVPDDNDGLHYHSGRG